ncbi:NACHT domain-containing protein [Nocardiopsis lucentensis]|uniref:NACHT domain-containing protein n=1 Tax=Nocardiopsis lucentensis TaxID=53441 RepID=UPI00036A29A4|nr:ATP-binding protein [Nocardiopsis lucentensis]
MARQLTYSDALKVLGENDSQVLDLAEKLTDGGLGLVGVPDLFGLRGELVSRGRQAIEGIGDKLRGRSRMSRTERIEAAHQILTVVSFFEALEESLEELDAPFTLADLKITKAEQAELVNRALGRESAVPSLSLDTGPAPLVSSDLLIKDFTTALTALTVAEEHGVTSEAHPLVEQLRELVPERAAQRYAESYRRLSAEVPEFGMWAHLHEHDRTRATLGTGLSDLRRRLEEIGSHRDVDTRRRELAAGYQAVLRQPVLRSDDAPPGLVLPSLEDAYIAPRARAARAVHSGNPSGEEWWERLPVIDDLQPVIAAHLVHPFATGFPTVILGHPGSGKSKFTEMLAARLPASDFLPVRVELRSVQPNAPIHVQIEEGLAATLHTRVSWRELADSADGALPVVILDGFDELLQATGVDRSDYLERVQEFQHQQEAMGQPVAVIVTSRTVVADRARFPNGTVVMRLEPFDDARIARMLDVWNRANARSLTESGLEPLAPKTLTRYRELAEQPLLLLMLLIYDADGNALQHASKALSNTELYERLLRMFARREVDKHRSGLSPEDFEEAVEDELRRLEVAALAMFTRRRQSVSAAELDRDLAVLMPDAAVRPSDTDLHGAIAPAAQVLGRFFFVHESRARAAEGRASVFEFLHSTFGEYLVARAVVAALEEAAESRARSSRRRGRGARPDDGELYALSSFASYGGRDRVVDFLRELVEHRLAEDPELRAEYGALLVELFQEAPFPAPNRSHTEYEPVRLPLTQREANYTSNLVILLCLVREDPVDARELFPDAAEPDQALQHSTTLWRTLPGAEWFSILSTLRVRHLDGWGEEGVRTVIGVEDGSPVDVGECVGFELRVGEDFRVDVVDPYGVTVPFDSVTSRLLRSAAMRVNGTAARFTLGSLPYLRHVSTDLGTWFRGPDDEGPWSEMHEVMRLRFEPATVDPGKRLTTYRRLLLTNALGRRELLVLTQAVEDLAHTPGDSDLHMVLPRVLNDFLNGVRSVVTGPRLCAESVEPVLRALAPHVSDTDLARVRALVEDANPAEVGGTADTAGPKPETSPQEPKRTRKERKVAKNKHGGDGAKRAARRAEQPPPGGSDGPGQNTPQRIPADEVGLNSAQPPRHGARERG